MSSFLRNNRPYNITLLRIKLETFVGWRYAQKGKVNSQRNQPNAVKEDINVLLHRIARACCRYELSNVVLYYIVNIPGNRGLSIPRLGMEGQIKERERRKKEKRL